jgi:hypothetical protein
MSFRRSSEIRNFLRSHPSWATTSSKYKGLAHRSSLTWRMTRVTKWGCKDKTDTKKWLNPNALDATVFVIICQNINQIQENFKLGASYQQRRINITTLISIYCGGTTYWERSHVHVLCKSRLRVILSKLKPWRHWLWIQCLKLLGVGVSGQYRPHSKVGPFWSPG